MKSITIFILTAGLLGLVSGCSTMESAWKGTKKVYRDYVNTNPSVDLDDPAAGAEEEQKLALLFGPMDRRLNQLQHFVEGKDAPPEDAFFRELMYRFQWISGIAVVDTLGNVHRQIPETSIKPLLVNEFMESVDDWSDHSLKAAGFDTDFGPEIYIGLPFYQEDKWQGATLIYFDPRTLVKFSPDPDELIVLTPDLPLWKGKYSEDCSVCKADWPDILEKDVGGEWSDNGNEYYWLARYLGDLRLIYAVSVSRET